MSERCVPLSLAGCPCCLSAVCAGNKSERLCACTGWLTFTARMSNGKFRHAKKKSHVSVIATDGDAAALCWATMQCTFGCWPRAFNDCSVAELRSWLFSLWLRHTFRRAHASCDFPGFRHATDTLAHKSTVILYTCNPLVSRGLCKVLIGHPNGECKGLTKALLLLRPLTYTIPLLARYGVLHDGSTVA